MPRSYLGDAVYVERERTDVVLITSDGFRDTNTIVLEPEVLRELLGWIEEQKQGGRL